MKSFILCIISIFTLVNIFVNAQINSPNDICGTDNRILLGHPAVGRIWTGDEPATGWILFDGRIVTAAHVLEGDNSGWIEFNVGYFSDGDCDNIHHPSAEHQYEINFSSIVKSSNTTISNDWAIFSVNPSEGKMPIERQNTFFYVEQATSPDNLMLFGFGSDETPEEFCYLQQKSVGEYLGLDGTIIKHNADTEGGSSGSPIINVATGKVVGVHTNPSCSTLGYNQGTSTFNTSFWTALNPYNFIVHQKRNSGSELTGTSIGRWIGSQTSGAFQDYPVGATGALIEDVIYGNYETFKGKQDITSSSPEEKFNKWSNSADIINFQKFLIEYPTSEITSQFDLVQDGVVIKNEYPEIPLLNPPNDEIEFKDPWLVDYDDPTYNGSDKRSRGISALFKTRNAPFYPNYDTSYGLDQYLGLFLDQTLQGGNYYAVRSPIQQPQDVYLSQTGKYHKFYFGHWSSTGTDPLTQNNIVNGFYESPVVFRSGSATVTANLKGTQLSNQTNAYSNTSQRRFIQTPDDVKHICYESMGKVWYELSTDNGATWFLGNGGKPLSSTDSKNPSMSFYGNQVGIVWQEKNGGTFNIKLAVNYSANYASSVFSTLVNSDGADYSYNANPVVEWGYNGKAVVVWSGFDMCENPFGGTALKYWYGDATSGGISQFSQCAIAGTDANSINPTITANYSVYSNPYYFHFAWQQVINSSTSKINYCKLYAFGNNLANTTFEEASLNSGFSKNYNPVIVLKKFGTSEYIYVTWLGNRTSPTTETKVLLKYKLGTNWSTTGVYGTSPVQNFSINKGTTIISNQEPLALCWSEQNTSPFITKLMKSPGSGNILILSNLTGRDMQINNGTTFSSMFANSFSSASLPYSFSLSQNFGSINKENSMQIFNGREGVVGKNGAQFFFALGDISINGQNINFVSVPDSVSIGSLQLLNTYFESESFTVNSSSNLIYGVQYGITDSLLCSSALSENEQINFKVELLDALTNEVLGVYDEVTYNKQNVYQYNNMGYQVNLSGIGNRTVKFRL
jgi:V8-like Glu-specific endopeptidase